jgi:hypothetical protein
VLELRHGRLTHPPHHVNLSSVAARVSSPAIYVDYAAGYVTGATLDVSGGR